jgi:hypothetical protein
MNIFRRVYGNLLQHEAASFTSAYDLEESVGRLSAATIRSPWHGLLRRVPMGTVSAYQVILQRPRPFFANPLAPVFHGAFAERNTVVTVEGDFLIEPFVIWYLNVLCIGYFIWEIFLPFMGFGMDRPPIWCARFLDVIVRSAFYLIVWAGVKLGRWLARFDTKFIGQEITGALRKQGI